MSKCVAMQMRNDLTLCHCFFETIEKLFGTTRVSKVGPGSHIPYQKKLSDSSPSVFISNSKINSESSDHVKSALYTLQSLEIWAGLFMAKIVKDVCSLQIPLLREGEGANRTSDPSLMRGPLGDAATWTPVCTFFLNNQCWRGHRCPYLHVDPSIT